MTELRTAVILALCACSGLTVTARAIDPNESSEAGLYYVHPSRGHVAEGFASPDPEPPRALTYHDGNELVCSQCHVMHASQQHPHDGQLVPDPFGPFPQNFVESAPLLKAFDPVALCLTCHDGVAGIPDVVTADVNALTERSGGHFESPGVDNPRGHKIDYNIDTSPGPGPGPGSRLCRRCHSGGSYETAAVTCIDCHNPHGNGRPRNLQWAADPGGEPQFGLLIDPAATGLGQYETASVAYGTTNDVNLREVTNICLDCHHVFTGPEYNDPENNDIHNRHPSYDSERGDPNDIAQGAADGTTDPVHWENGVGGGFQITPRLRFVNDGATDFISAQAVDATINGVFCITCHKVHGSDYAFGLRWDPVSGVTAEGCDQCHNKTGQ